MDLFELVGRISIQGTADATREINTVTGTAQQSSGIFGTVGGKIAAAVAGAFATQKIIAFGKDVISTTQTFSDSMLKVQSLSGASGEELQKLNDTALQYGSTTAWTSSQVADAMGYMALAGFDTNQILSATPGILGLASAAGTDLARTSDILTDALTAFGYEAKDAALFADVLATTQAKSNTTVDALGEAFKYCGTVAGTYKYKIEDVSAALGLMANSGIKGSMAGTSFATIITRLATNAGASSKSLGALDTLTQRLGVEFYNADGSARDLNLVLTEMIDAMKDLDAAEQAEIAKKIAGMEAQKGLMAMVNQGSEAYAELKDRLDNCAGSASDMSSTMESGIGGAIRTMQSAIEGFKIKLGQKFEPYIAEALQKVAKFVTGTVVPTMDGLFEKIDKFKEGAEPYISIAFDKLNTFINTVLIPAFDGVVYIVSETLSELGKDFKPAITTALEFLSSFVTNTLMPTINDIFGKMSELKQWGEEHSTLITNIVSLIEILTAAMIGFKAGAMIQGVVNTFQAAQVTLALYSATAEGATIAQGFLNGTLTFGETIVALLTGKITLAELATALWSKAQLGLNAAMSANPIGLIVMAIAAVIAIIVVAYNKSETFRNFVNSLWEKLKEFAAWVADGFVSAWNVIVEFFTTKLPNAFNKVVEFFTTTIPNAFGKVITFFSGLPGKIGEFLTNAKNKIINWGTETAEKAKEAGQTFLNNVITFFKELPYNVGVILGTVIGTIANFGKNTAIKAKEIGINFVNNVVTFFRELPGRIFLFVTTAYNNVVNWVEEMKLKAIEVGTEFLLNIVTFFTELPGKVSQFITNTYNNIVTWGTNVKNKAIETGKNFLTNIINFFKQLPGKAKDFLTNTINRIIEFARNMKNKAVEAGNNFVTTIITKLSELPGKVINIGKSIVEGLWNGITNAGNWLKNQITNFANGIIDGFKSAFDINSPSKKMMVIGEFVDEGLGVGLTGSDASVNAIQDKFGKVMNVAKSSLKGINNLVTNEPLSDINFGANINREISESPMQKYQVQFNAQFNTLNDGFERLISLIGEYLPDIASNSEKQIVLDGNALAIGMSRKIDRQLGRISTAKGRGNV